MVDCQHGKVKPKESTGHGFTYRFNGTWKPRDGLTFYGTWSKGFRPGGINRQPGLAPFTPDYLINYELGVEDLMGSAALEWRPLSSALAEDASSATWA